METAYADAKGLRRAAVARALQWGLSNVGNIVGPLLMQQWGPTQCETGDGEPARLSREPNSYADMPLTLLL